MNCSVPIDVVVKGWNNIKVVFDAPKIAVLVGTTAGFQLVAVLKVPEPGLSSQVAFCACADVAASNAAAAVVANKYARIPAPLRRCLNADGFLLQDCRSSTLEAMLLEPGNADSLQPVALRPRMRDQFRPRR